MLLSAFHRVTGRAGFVASTDAEIRELFANTTPRDSQVTEDEITRLPPAVARWINRTGVVGRSRPTSARLLQRGQLRASPKGPFMTARADQYVRIADPAFIWRVEAKLFKVVSFTGRDRYSDGRGNMRIALASRVNVVDAADDKIAQGALLRFLAELVWYPGAALEPYISWEALGETQARALLEHAGLSVTADFSFDPLGRVVGISAKRFLGGGEEATLQPWRVECTSWQCLDAVEVPTTGSVGWDPPAGSFDYYRWEITALEYDRPAPFEAGSVWS